MVEYLQVLGLSNCILTVTHTEDILHHTEVLAIRTSRAVIPLKMFLHEGGAGLVGPP